MTFVFDSAEDFWAVYNALPESIQKFAFASKIHNAIAVCGAHVQTIKDYCAEHHIDYVGA